MRSIALLISCLLLSISTTFAQITIDSERFINDLQDTAKVIQYTNVIIDIHSDGEELHLAKG